MHLQARSMTVLVQAVNESIPLGCDNESALLCPLQYLHYFHDVTARSSNTLNQDYLKGQLDESATPVRTYGMYVFRKTSISFARLCQDENYINQGKKKVNTHECKGREMEASPCHKTKKII